MEPAIPITSRLKGEKCNRRNKSSESMPNDRGQPARHRRNMSDLGSNDLMRGSSWSGRSGARRGSLSMLAHQSRMLELEKAGAPCVRYVCDFLHRQSCEICTLLGVQFCYAQQQSVANSLVC